MDWMETVYEYKSSKFATDSQLHIGLDISCVNLVNEYDLNSSPASLNAYPE